LALVPSFSHISNASIPVIQKHYIAFCSYEAREMVNTEKPSLQVLLSFSTTLASCLLIGICLNPTRISCGVSKIGFPKMNLPQSGMAMRKSSSHQILIAL